MMVKQTKQNLVYVKWDNT